jgi:hypothetical protein
VCENADVCGLGDGILVRAGGRLAYFGGPTDFEEDFRGFEAVAGAGAMFAGMRNRTVLQLFDVYTFPAGIAMIVATGDVIQCFAVSEVFHLIVVVTRDDRLHYYSMNKLYKTHMVELPLCCARRVAISQSWGFVVVDFGSKLAVFTVNGEFVRIHGNESEFVYWNCVRSRSDFDFIVYADLRGNLGIFDVYEDEQPIILTEIQWPVCLVEYDAAKDSLVVVSTTGHLMLISHPFSDIKL